MKRRNILILVLLSLCIFGCENAIDNGEWPEYTERLVVRASLEYETTDTVFVTCTVKRTIPMSEIYIKENAIVPTANVTLLHDNESYTVPLISETEADYQIILPVSGDNTYTLIVQNGDKKTQATIHVDTVGYSAHSAMVKKVKYGYNEQLRLAIPVDFSKGYGYRVYIRYRREGMDAWSGERKAEYIPESSYSWEYHEIVGDTLVYYFDISSIYGGEIVEVESKVYTLSEEYVEFQQALSSYYSGDLFGTGDYENPNFNFMDDGIGLFWFICKQDWSVVQLD